MTAREATPEECQQAIAAARAYEPVKVVPKAFAESLRARCILNRHRALAVSPPKEDQ